MEVTQRIGTFDPNCLGVLDKLILTKKSKPLSLFLVTRNIVPNKSRMLPSQVSQVNPTFSFADAISNKARSIELNNFPSLDSNLNSQANR
ncbi:hypothetical protein CEXT_353261 [Caerostris extrusa]|uniref:Uncharacterized protein n=1 Tax=Caerostris extrusa TaxID=172846 RepID=A0AAV4VW38_CAEEX|nr:hypothetical protein CEXT_353261 [Caerostris extrusa]